MHMEGVNKIIGIVILGVFVLVLVVLAVSRFTGGNISKTLSDLRGETTNPTGTQVVAPTITPVPLITPTSGPSLFERLFGGGASVTPTPTTQVPVVEYTQQPTQQTQPQVVRYETTGVTNRIPNTGPGLAIPLSTLALAAGVYLSRKK